MTLEEKNKIVAEFDDAISWDKERELWFNEARNNNSGGWQEYLTYNTDYNELHRVWVKFRDLEIKDSRKSFEHIKFKEGLSDNITYKPISVAFENLVTAIIWYNSITTKTS